ncbi:MAG: hypothetical protein ABIK68_01350 [bacterium]
MMDRILPACGNFAVDQKWKVTAVAMLVTTLVLAVGFWLFMFASMNHLFNFGLLTGVTLVFAFLADILLAPALLAIVTPDRVAVPSK